MARKQYPSDQDRYNISFPPGMRERIQSAARTNHRTMNAEIVHRLQESFDPRERNGPPRPINQKIKPIGSMNMNQTITIDHLRAMPVGQIAALNANELARLQAESARALESAKLTKDLLDGVLGRKYADRAAMLRNEAGKDFGSIRFNDGDVQVVVDLPKLTAWDQKILGEIAEEIRISGDNPKEYMETTFKVSESKYKAWPESIRQVFEPARTVKAGKPKFKLSVAEMEQVV